MHPLQRAGLAQQVVELRRGWRQFGLGRETGDVARQEGKVGADVAAGIDRIAGMEEAMGHAFQNLRDASAEVGSCLFRQKHLQRFAVLR